MLLLVQQALLVENLAAVLIPFGWMNFLQQLKLVKKFGGRIPMETMADQLQKPATILDGLDFNRLQKPA